MSCNKEKKAKLKKFSLLKLFSFLILPVLSLCCFGSNDFSHMGGEFASAKFVSSSDYQNSITFDDEFDMKLSTSDNKVSLSYEDLTSCIPNYNEDIEYYFTYLVINSLYYIPVEYSNSVSSQHVLPTSSSSVYYRCYYLTSDDTFNLHLRQIITTDFLSVTSVSLYYVSVAVDGYTQTDIDNSYNSGYTAGQESVDITQDNDQAISDYIIDNNYHTDSEYNQYGENQYNSGYTAGQESVDITQDNDQAISDYITDNNYHTDSEYNQYGESQYNSGYVDCIDDYAIDKTYNIESVYLVDSDGWNYYEYILLGNITEISSVSMTLHYYDVVGSMGYNKTLDLLTTSLPYSVMLNGVELATITYADNKIVFTHMNDTCDLQNIVIKYKGVGYREQDIDLSYSNGHDDGYKVGYDTGNSDGYAVGKTDGIEIGKTEAMNSKDTMSGLIYSIIDAPFNVLASAFDFEVFGINIASFLITIVSLLIVAFVLKKLL